MNRIAAIPVVAAKALILVWRWGLAPVMGANCRFTPSCSAYAWEALGRHGILRGGWLTVWRILRCNPWGGCGDDPVPGSGTARHEACAPDNLEHPAADRRRQGHGA